MELTTEEISVIFDSCINWTNRMSQNYMLLPEFQLNSLFNSPFSFLDFILNQIVWKCIRIKRVTVGFIDLLVDVQICTLYFDIHCSLLAWAALLLTPTGMQSSDCM